MKTILDKTIWLAENLMAWKRVEHPAEVRETDQTCFKVENCNVIVFNSIGEPLWPWQPFSQIECAWDVVEQITALPKTKEQADRFARFIQSFDKAFLWSYPSEEAAERISNIAIQAMGYSSDALKKLP